MKDINLLVHAYSTKALSKDQLSIYNRFESGTPSDNNRLCDEENLKSFIKLLKIRGFEFYEHFYWSFTIPQISKEFDILRISDDSVVNIELKSEDNPEKIEEQLNQNRYYLNSLNRKNIFCYAYVSENNKLYTLYETAIIETKVEELILDLSKQTNIVHGINLEEMFKPNQFLVSPFNDVDKFLKNEYFLTDHQMNIVNKIKNCVNEDRRYVFSIIGDAGTGKTLLTYDLYKSLVSMGVKTAIFHCANLNDGQKTLISNGYTIYPIKKYDKFSYEDYRVLIIDESQRLYDEQIEFILSKSDEYKFCIVFSYDPKQYLCKKEEMSNVIEKITSTHDFEFKLTNKIRCSEEIQSISKDLFNLCHRTMTIYQNVKLFKFRTYEKTREYIEFQTKSNSWVYINYTTSLYKSERFDELSSVTFGNAHQVIGQEYDKVIVTINEDFFYEDKILKSRDSKNPYIAVKMLYEAITRCREELIIIVIKNDELFNQVLEMLNKK